MHRSNVSRIPLRALCAFALALTPSACSSVYDQGGADAGNGQRPGAPPLTPDIDVRTDGPVGWASVNALGQNGTNGGGTATPTVVTTFDALTTAVSGDAP